jgi:hypothetical protein
MVLARGALEKGVHDLGLSYAQELHAALEEALYEVPKRLAGLLGACTQILGVSRAHVRALEVPHEGADQIVPVVDLAGRQVLEPRLCRVGEMQGEVTDDNLVGGGPAQLTRQAVFVAPYTGVRLPVVFVDRRGLAEALGKLAVRISQLNTRVPGGSGVGERSSRLS